MYRKLLTMFVCLSLIGSVQAILIEDPTEKAYKSYLGVEISVDGHPVYIEDYYKVFLTGKLGAEQNTPTITVLNSPLEVKMTTKVPARSRFYPSLREDGSKRNFKGTVVKEDASFSYLEYTLMEGGAWLFFMESDFDVDRFSFTLNTLDGSGSGGNPVKPNLIDIQLCDNKYKPDEKICLSGGDLNNQNVKLSYAGVSNIDPASPIKAVAGETELFFRDTTGKKGNLTLSINVEESGFKALLNQYWKHALGILVLLFLIVRYGKKK